MPDYKTMYINLFNSVSEAIKILCDAQRKAEETYIASSEKDDEILKTLKL